MLSAIGLKRRGQVTALGMLIWLFFGSAVGQSPRPASSSPAMEESPTPIHTAPVVVDGITLFYVRGVSAYPAEKRAEEIAGRIRTLARNRAYSPQWFKVQETPLGTRILANDQFIMTVYDPDARLENVDRQVLARAHVLRIGEAIESFRRERDPELLLRRTFYSIATTLALLLALWAGRLLVRKTRSLLETRYRRKIRGLQIQSFDVIRAENIWRALNGALTFLWAAVALTLGYVNVHYVLSLFPWTREAANGVFNILATPVVSIGRSMLDTVPDLIFLFVITLVTVYLLKLIRLFFRAVETGTVTLHGFEAEWARPTNRLVRLAVIAIALVAAYPYIPGSNSQAFKGISLLLGVIFSLGSSSLIANMISGYSMTYRRVFKQGDRVRIGDYIGDVEDIKLMMTYLRTPKNEVISVPNSQIINGAVINYSTLAHKQGLILHTTVGIGYETSWRQVEAMLIEAARRTQGLLRRPEPFVLQKELGDFAVTYEINAYCDEPGAMEMVYTALHKNILDVFNEYSVQIMTPAYEADPKQAKIVPKEQWYPAPAHLPEDLQVTASNEKSGAA